MANKKGNLVPHPAKYSDKLLPLFGALLAGYSRVLDPFAGTGKLRLLKNGCHFYLVEMEPEWAIQGPSDAVADSLHLPFPAALFDAVCTSPCYGNRMADHHNAMDGSRRISYRHCIGRPLHPGNSGQLHWGPKYRDFHVAAWSEVRRVLRTGGRFILNVSDHIRKGERIEVSDWHLDTLVGLGFVLEEKYEIETPRQRFGANGSLRVDHENVFMLRR
jgi:SAM-dependent methyltransferase